MAVRIEKKDRRLIPNWRSFSTTISLGELNSCFVTPVVKPNLSIDEYIEDFHSNETIPFAADLVSASMVNGFNNNEDVKDAAKFILDRKNMATQSQCDIAERIIYGIKAENNNRIDNITIKELNNCLPKDDYKRKIQRLKKYVIDFPYNPVAWVEMSRYYSILGQEKQSIKSMKVAIQLAPQNRFVLRCAVRLFSHYSEIDLAHDILKRNRITNYDPWLTSAEISIATLQGKSSRFIKRGIALVESQNLSPFSITELAGSIATVNLLSGDRKKSRKMFIKSLVSPNDNSIAQIEWVLNNKDKLLFDKESINVKTKYNFEAQAIANFYNKNLIEALNNTCQWFCDMPFSRRPVLLGSCIADILDNRRLAIEFLEKGLIAHVGDAQMLNNKAYYLALDNETNTAKKCLKKANRLGINKFIEICLMATEGLICFREKKYEEGRFLYLQAIKETVVEKNKELNWTAILNYAREEILAKTDKIESVMQLVSKIPNDEDNDISIKKLRSEVMSLYDKYKQNPDNLL